VILTPFGYQFGSYSAKTLSPVLVDVAEISSMTVRMVVSGRPRQLMVIKLKRRCSIWGEMRYSLAERGRAPADRGAAPKVPGGPRGAFRRRL